MSFNDRPLHLSELSICKKMPHTEASVCVPVVVTQSALDGLQAMIRFCEGMEAAGKGRISGSFELIMFYRALCHDIATVEAEAQKLTAASETNDYLNRFCGLPPNPVPGYAGDPP
jgi:hypothetical protein